MSGSNFNITTKKAVTDDTERSVLSGVDVDFETDHIKTKTLSSNTTLTFSNPVLGKTVLLEIDSAVAETLTLPATATVLDGSYDTSGKVNTIFILCNDSVTPEYLIIIKQKP